LSGTYLCYPQLAPCNGVYCGQNEVCREGQCVNPCEPNPCEWWQSCWVNRYGDRWDTKPSPNICATTRPARRRGHPAGMDSFA
jgi:hypothetical protein